MDESNNRLHLVSWNVAGLTTTVGTAMSCLPKGSTFFEYLDLWKADIFAFQEAKVPRSRLDADPFACGVAPVSKGETPAWESFWAYACKGMNGVATFARPGMVHRADNRPLRVPKFDDEGRCLATFFSAFTLFNVYVPNARDGARTQFRTDFVTALRAAMRRVRAETGLPIILAGDLNMTYRPEDCTWVNRRLDLRKMALPFDPETTKYTAAELEHFLPRVTRTGVMNQILQWLKWEPLPAGVEAGTPEAWAHVEAEAVRNSPAPESDGAASSRAKIRDVYVYPFLRSAHGSTYNRLWYRAATAFGLTGHGDEANAALGDGLIRDDGMIDSFTFVRPEARARYTCFNQLENRRYEHEGSRIDYILVDRGALSDALIPGLEELPSDEIVSNAIKADNSTALLTFSEFDGPHFQAGMAAATANGKFQAVPFIGGGMPALTRANMDVQFATPPHTGLIYTAPQLSDHIAVTALFTLREPLRPRAKDAKFDEPTKAAIYRKVQESIASFFSKVSVKRPSVPPVTEASMKAHRTEGSLTPAGSVEIIVDD